MRYCKSFWRRCEDFPCVFESQSEKQSHHDSCLHLVFETPFGLCRRRHWTSTCLSWWRVSPPRFSGRTMPPWHCKINWESSPTLTRMSTRKCCHTIEQTVRSPFFATIRCVPSSPESMNAIDGTTLSITPGATFAQCWAMLLEKSQGKVSQQYLVCGSVRRSWMWCIWFLRLAAHPVLFSFCACAQSALWTRVHQGLDFLILLPAHLNIHQTVRNIF